MQNLNGPWKVVKLQQVGITLKDRFGISSQKHDRIMIVNYSQLLPPDQALGLAQLIAKLPEMQKALKKVQSSSHFNEMSSILQSIVNDALNVETQGA